MKYTSIDTETTGLDDNYCQILSVGAVVEDTEKPLSFIDIPKFHCYIYYDKIVGQPYALNLNKDIIEAISKNKPKDDGIVIVDEIRNICLLNINDVTMLFKIFLKSNGIDTNNVVVAGKNYNAFDRKFLSQIPQWNEKIKVHRRVLDPCTSLIRHTDNVPPDLQECLRRVNIIKGIAHDAVEDAFDVVQVLRHVIK